MERLLLFGSRGFEGWGADRAGWAVLTREVMAFVMQVLGTRASRCTITMGKRNRSLHSGAAFTPNGPALFVVVVVAVNRLVGSHPESELLLLGPYKAAAAAARLTTLASARPKELMWVD